jgi:predicted nuclease of predicted toxin-antitoxin system
VIRFHLDEHVDPAIAAGLRARGIDVTTTIEAGLESATDEAHLQFALGEGRVIFTQDRDFLRLHATGIPHAGIAYCEQQTRSIGELIRYLALMHDCLTEEDVAGQVEFL